MNTRRNLLSGVGVVALAAGAAACSQIDVQKFEAELVDIIDKIQRGVKDACSLVPAANSVLAVLMAIAGANAGVAAFLAAVDTGIRLISQVCPQPAAAGAKAAPVSATVNGKTVPITFY